MKITRVINNNVICAVNDRHQERILLGSGIGFGKKKGDLVEKDKIEKEFFLKSKSVSGKLFALISQIPMEYVRVTDSIIQYAQNNLETELNENIYLTLIDHINFAVNRHEHGLEFKNALFIEIKKFYKNEFKIAEKALEIIKNELGIELPIDEAASIALHIVNAELGADIEETLNITQFIQKILNVVRYHYQINFEEDSFHYTRFVTHLKFLAYRFFHNIALQEDDREFQQVIRDRYIKEYECSRKINHLIIKDYGKELTEEEIIFLTIHIKRVTSERQIS